MHALVESMYVVLCLPIHAIKMAFLVTRSESDLKALKVLLSTFFGVKNGCALIYRRKRRIDEVGFIFLLCKKTLAKNMTRR